MCHHRHTKAESRGQNVSVPAPQLDLRADVGIITGICPILAAHFPRYFSAAFHFSGERAPDVLLPGDGSANGWRRRPFGRALWAAEPDFRRRKVADTGWTWPGSRSAACFGGYDSQQVTSIECARVVSGQVPPRDAPLFAASRMVMPVTHECG